MVSFLYFFHLFHTYWFAIRIRIKFSFRMFSKIMLKFMILKTKRGLRKLYWRMNKILDVQDLEDAMFTGIFDVRNIQIFSETF